MFVATIDGQFYRASLPLVRKLLDSIVAWQGATELFRERLGYDSSGSVTSRTWLQSAAWPPVATTEQYAYDGVGRLAAWWVGADTTRYDYDAWGNRVGWANSAAATTGVGTYGNGTPNRLSSTVTRDQFNTVVDGPNTASFDAIGSTTGRSHFDPGTGITRTETFGYSWRDLTRRYIAAPPGSPALTPANDWRYRYSTSAEREQKRMYSWRQLNDTVTHSRAWVYYALGLGKEQLAVYNGLEVSMTMPKAFCDELMPDRVYMYPTEYNTYGNGALAVTTRPDATSASGVKEYRVSDALGSTRVVMTATSVAASDYLPYGQAVTGLTVGPPTRTTYIGREVDIESAIGDFGFRRYDEVDGRFLSVDPLWSMAPGVSPYVYSENDPLNRTDPLGLFGERPDNDNGQSDPLDYTRPPSNHRPMRPLAGPPLSGSPEGPILSETPGGSGESDEAPPEPTISSPRIGPELMTSWLIRHDPMLGPSYGLLDAAFVILTRRTTSQARHIDGRFANDREVTDAGVNLIEGSLLFVYGQALYAVRTAAQVRAVIAEAEAYLGAGARVIKNPAGDMIFQSADKLREIRFDFRNFSPHKAPHVHVIKYVRKASNKVRTVDKRRFPK